MFVRIGDEGETRPLSLHVAYNPSEWIELVQLVWERDLHPIFWFDARLHQADALNRNTFRLQRLTERKGKQRFRLDQKLPGLLTRDALPGLLTRDALDEGPKECGQEREARHRFTRAGRYACTVTVGHLP